MAKSPFIAVEEAFQTVADALDNLATILRSQGQSALVDEPWRGTDVAWRRKQELKAMNKDLREQYQKVSAICTAVGALAIKPKRDQTGRYAEQQERKEYNRRH